MSNPGAPVAVIDASVWVSRLVPQDVFHSPVKAWMQARRDQGGIFLSPALLLVEVAGAIARRTGDVALAGPALDSLQNLPGLRLVEIDHALVQESARLAASLALCGADALYVAVAVQLQLPLITLDVDQRQKAAPMLTMLDASFEAILPR